MSDSAVEWPGIPEELRIALSAAWGFGVPALATAIFGRWWQFETWIRSLVYVELKSKFGPVWHDKVPNASEKRQKNEESISYMPTSDVRARLAYTDFGGLLSIIHEHWNLFEPSLMSKDIWTGRVAEIRHIRNRMGHCRRPHPDDLSRLHQMLRDLENGAFVALSAFNRRSCLEEDRDEPLVNAWLRREHEAANRLLDHAARQYEIDFRLTLSRRPWADLPADKSNLSGEPGLVWHAEWLLRGDHHLDVGSVWKDTSLDPWRDAILLVCATSSSEIEVSFSAMENPVVVADAIGRFFDVLIRHQRAGCAAPENYENWCRMHAALDPRVQAGGPWSIVGDSTTPITLFGA